MNVYDFDKTIYRGDSTIDFYLFSVARKSEILRFLPYQFFSFLLYKLHKIRKTQFKERFFIFLKNIDVEKFVFDFWLKNKNKIAKWYLEQQKDDDVIISASPDFLLEPICKMLSISNLICTKVDVINGKFISENCYGHEKVVRFKKEFPNAKIEKFYSDSISDLPMAMLAKEAFIVKRGKCRKWELSDN